MAEANGINGNEQSTSSRTRKVRKTAGASPATANGSESSLSLGTAAAAVGVIALAWGMFRLFRRRPGSTAIARLKRSPRPSLIGSMLRSALISVAGVMAGRLATQLTLTASREANGAAARARSAS